MTREEAIKYIKSRCIGSAEERDGTQWSEAMWMAIEALQCNEMCEECRNAMNEMIAKIQKKIAEGPKCKQCLHNPEHPFTTNRSVEQKTGKWIKYDSTYRTAICSRCEKVTMFETWDGKVRPYDFCPNCGSRNVREDGEEE